MHKPFLPSVLLLCFCLGCGTGEYESRIGGHGGGSAAAGADLLGPAEDLPGTRVTIRVPRRMTLLPASADPKRAQPLPFAPTGQQRVYEGFVQDSDGGETPFYCYFVTMEVPKVPGVNMLDQMKAAMKKMPGSVPQLVDFHVTGSDGKESTWQMAHGPDKSDFYYKGKDGKETLRPMDETAEMYVRVDGGYFILLGWRVPSNIEQNVGDVGLAELAKAVAGGVSVRPQ